MLSVDASTCEVTVNRLAAGEEALWEEALERSTNGTFYHDLRFAAVHAWRAQATVNLVCRQRGRILAILPAGIIEVAGRRELCSPFSASFAGFAVPRRLSLRQALSMVEAVERWATEEGFGRLVIQQPPAIYWERFDETIEFALRHSGFEQVALEVTYYLTDLKEIDDVVLRNARRAVGRGCVFGETVDVAGTWEFLATVKAMRGHPFDLRQQDLLRLRELFPDRVRCFEVVRDGRRVAAMLAYGLNRRVLLGFHWAQLPDAQQYRPSDLLVLEAARWALASGFRVVDLGTATIGGTPEWGVTQFKEKFRPLAALRRRFAKTIA